MFWLITVVFLLKKLNPLSDHFKYSCVYLLLSKLDFGMWKERDNTGLSCLKINVKCHSDTVRTDKAPPPGRTFLPTNCEKTQIDVTHTQTSSDDSFPWKPKCSLAELLIQACNYRQEEEDLVCITGASWATRGERGILRFALTRFALRAKYRVRLAFIKRVLCRSKEELTHNTTNANLRSRSLLLICLP